MEWPWSHWDWNHVFFPSHLGGSYWELLVTILQKDVFFYQIFQDFFFGKYWGKKNMSFCKSPLACRGWERTRKRCTEAISLAINLLIQSCQDCCFKHWRMVSAMNFVVVNFDKFACMDANLQPIHQSDFKFCSTQGPKALFVILIWQQCRPI